jgi:hypothetical protein
MHFAWLPALPELGHTWTMYIRVDMLQSTLTRVEWFWVEIEWGIDWALRIGLGIHDLSKDVLQIAECLVFFSY